MPKKYTVLLYRDVFTRGRAYHGPVDENGNPLPTDGAPRPPGPTPSTTRSDPAILAEATLSLKGIADVDGEYVAFVEDQTAGKTLVLKTGDRVARGQVKDMTMAAMGYERDGKVQQVEVGQNLRGEVAATFSGSAPVYGTPGSAPPPTGSTPAAAGGTDAAAPAPAASSSQEEVLRRMREKRAREGG